MRSVSDEGTLRALLLMRLRISNTPDAPLSEADLASLRVWELLRTKCLDAWVNEDRLLRRNWYVVILRFLSNGGNATGAAGSNATLTVCRDARRHAEDFLTFAADWLDAKARRQAERAHDRGMTYDAAAAACEAICGRKKSSGGDKAGGCPVCPRRFI